MPRQLAARSERHHGLLAIVAFLIAVGWAADARPQADDVERGRQLFSGAVPLARGGPACAACHDAAGLARPGGGTMGPDLTNVAARIGPQGVTTSLSTLFFPTMAPLFSAHPLTADEQRALAAFLVAPAPGPPHTALATTTLGSAAVVGAAILLGVTGFAGRTRIRSVRLTLLARVAATRTDRAAS